MEPVAEPPTVLVDARNVIRSVWPNMSPTSLVAHVRAWADAAGVRAVLVFDGRRPAGEDDERVAIVGTAGESADDWIARAANELARGKRRYRLVTSDRELRARAGGGAEEIVGGGAFVRALSRSGASAPTRAAAPRRG